MNRGFQVGDTVVGVRWEDQAGCRLTVKAVVGNCVYVGDPVYTEQFDYVTNLKGFRPGFEMYRVGDYEIGDRVLFHGREGVVTELSSYRIYSMLVAFPSENTALAFTETGSKQAGTLPTLFHVTCVDG